MARERLAIKRWRLPIEREQHMNDQSFAAEFGALREEEQSTVVGGDSGIASTIGWFVGYAIGCTALAVQYDYKLLTKQPLIFVEGYGFM